MGMLWVYLIKFKVKEHPPDMKTIKNMFIHLKDQFTELSYFWQFTVCCILIFSIIVLGMVIYQ